MTWPLILIAAGLVVFAFALAWADSPSPPPTSPTIHPPDRLWRGNSIHTR